MSAAYLNTRVSLYAERRWSPRQFDALLGAADEDLPEFLGRRGLSALVSGYDGRDSRSLEARLVALVLDETLVLLRPLRDAARQFILYWTERFEISNVKTLIRAKMAGERPAAILPRLLAMGPFSRLNLDDLVQVEDVGELLRRLEQTHYGEIVRHAREAFEESRDPFILDATLDRAYFEGLVHRARPLEQRPQGRALRELMADLVDRTNLVWLLRYRFNYGLPPAQVYYLLVNAGYRLDPGRLQQLVALPDIALLRTRLPGPLAEIVGDRSDILAINLQLEAAATERAARTLAHPAESLARVFAYLILRERDLRAVRAALRGRQLRLVLPAIRQALGEAA
jgi:V/A-type H+-transporting ATPase subunit C